MLLVVGWFKAAMETKPNEGTNPAAPDKAKEAPNAPSDQEIIDAINTSGYPFEIRLLTTFDKEGMDPVPYFRSATDEDSDTKEIDLLASYTERADGVRLTFRAVIEAKSMPSSERFVGFSWKRPSDHELRVARLMIGGLPPLREQPGHLWHLLFQEGGFAEALDPLNDGPVCVQWATIKPTQPGQGKGKVTAFTGKANHDDAYWKSLDALVRATEWRARESSCVPSWPKDQPILLFEYATVIIATEHLLVYDASANTLNRVDHFMLHRPFEVAGKDVVYRLVDFVTEKGVADFAQRYRSARDKVKAVIEASSPLLGTVFVAAAMQHQERIKASVGR